MPLPNRMTFFKGVALLALVSLLSGCCGPFWERHCRDERRLEAVE